MAATTRSNLHLEADFTEDTVGLALESFLTLLSFPSYRYTIEPFSRKRERWLGADARLRSDLKGFRPFYMQFKRPAAYRQDSKARIIVQRKKQGLAVAPYALYFGLREKRKTHNNYQHNVLFRLRERLIARGVGDATYVCPLFLDRSAYRFHVYMAGVRLWPRFWRHQPWDVEDILVHQPSGTVQFHHVPVLREHVSIPPHAITTSAKHSYSFTDQGTDLCFHSPLALPEGATSLSTFLTKVIGDLRTDAQLIQSANAHDELSAMFGQDEERSHPLLPADIRSELDGVQSWLRWGGHLREQYQIEQFALMQWAK